MASPTPAPQSPTPQRSEEPNWEMVVFQVEDRIFHAFKHTFERASDVFEGMFLLPQGHSGEGSSRDQPIVLHGCKKDDFAALMKFLHPMWDQIAFGVNELSKQEWIGALRLATMWEMEAVRATCVEKLFYEMDDVSGIDMVILARELRVRSWFVDGIRTLVLDFQETPLETVVEGLGVPTACKIANLYPRCAALGALEVVGPEDTYVRFSLDQVHCGTCFSDIIAPSVGCSRALCGVRDVPPVSGRICGVGFWEYGGRLGLRLTASSVLCAEFSCSERLFKHGNVACTSQCTGNSGSLYLGPTDATVDKLIETVFEEELKGFSQ